MLRSVNSHARIRLCRLRSETLTLDLEGVGMTKAEANRGETALGLPRRLPWRMANLALSENRRGLGAHAGEKAAFYLSVLS